MICTSSIAGRGQDATFTVFDVGDAAATGRRIRVRRTVAALDPRVEDSCDWAEQRCVDLIRATVADLATGYETTGDEATYRGTERAAGL